MVNATIKAILFITKRLHIISRILRLSFSTITGLSSITTRQLQQCSKPPGFDVKIEVF